MTARDCREPEVIRDPSGRVLLIDQAVLDVIRERVPPGEPGPTGLVIHQVRPFRLSFTTRPRA
jgi:hypothetical protein